MSGGHFDYMQYHIDEIADKIEEYIEGVDLDEQDIEYILSDRFFSDEEKEYIRKNHHSRPNEYGLSDETLKEFKNGLDYLRRAAIYAQRIDWLLSGDDGEDDFIERLKEDLEEYESSKKLKKS